MWGIFGFFSLGVIAVAQEYPIPTPQSVDFYGKAYINDNPVKKGTVITAYDWDGVRCGKFVVKREGHFGFMPVYGDDPTTPDIDEGASPGDIITFKIDGKTAQVTVKKINREIVDEKKGNIILPKWGRREIYMK